MDAKEFFLTQLSFNNRIVNENITDISHQELLQFHSGANCVNWLLGHIIYGRNLVLKIKTKPIWNEEAMKDYGRHVKAIEHKDFFISFEELKSLFNKSGEMSLCVDTENNMFGIHSMR